VYTDCAMSYPTFMIQGPKGEEAYNQADNISIMIKEHLQTERIKNRNGIIS